MADPAHTLTETVTLSEAIPEGEERVLLVPRHEGEFADVGIVADVVERMRLIEGGKKLEVMVTFYDPKIYTKPWTNRRTWTRQSSRCSSAETSCTTSRAC